MEPLRPNDQWRARAKCADPDVYPEVEVEDTRFPLGERNTELFYPPRNAALYPTIADAAKSLCYGRDGHGPCPVRRECLLYAINAKEVHGIFGGKSHRERSALLRRRVAQHPELTIEEYVNSEHCK